MELNEMTLNDVESRIAELDTEGKSTEEIEAMTEELKALNERKAELADLEARKKAAEAINEGKVAAAEVKTIEERKGEPEMMTVKEYRNSEEYINAFAEYVKTGKDEECRALLTTNVGEAGTIAVPDFVYEEIKTAWDNNDILNSVRRVEVKGNMKVQFEISGTDAVIHNEGSGAVAEETLVLGIVTLIPESIKKWISISDEALDFVTDSGYNKEFGARPLKRYIQKNIESLIAKELLINPSKEIINIDYNGNSYIIR
jgi:HK97 family phage major capsid protein